MLTKEIQELIEKIVKKAFTGFRLNLLGPEKVNKAFLFTLRGSDFDPKTTLTSTYLFANSLNSTNENSIDKTTIKRINDVAENYIDQLEQKTIADITRKVGDKFAEIQNEAKFKNISPQDVLFSPFGQEILEQLKKELLEQKKRIDKAASTIAEHELYNAQNYGAFDGVIAAAKSLGISDPNVVKIGVLDDKRCHHCWHLWTLPDKITPKVYKLSELSSAPGDWKSPNPSISPTHPNCRDVLVTIMPGFGFNQAGKIIYKGYDPETGELWDEYKHQRGR